MNTPYEVVLRTNWPLGHNAEQDKNTYLYDTACQNCHEALRIIIKKGIKVESVYGMAECPNCGCVAISEKSWDVKK